jgi:HSP20 family molecular chaperone IbpA
VLRVERTWLRYSIAPASPFDSVPKFKFWLSVILFWVCEVLSGKEDKERKPDISDLFNLKVFGVDFGEILKSWLGVADVSDLMGVNDPGRLEELRRRIEEQRKRFREFQDSLRKKFGDAVRFDYDIRVRSLVGDEGEFRIGRGRFFEKLDKSAAGGVGSNVGGVAPYRRVEDVREPLVDVIDGGDHLEVVAEVPGVDEGDVELRVEGDRLTLSTAEGSERRYRAEVALPSKVEPLPLERKYHNGVLKVKFRKKL